MATKKSDNTATPDIHKFVEVFSEADAADADADAQMPVEASEPEEAPDTQDEPVEDATEGPDPVTGKRPKVAPCPQCGRAADHTHEGS